MSDHEQEQNPFQIGERREEWKTDHADPSLVYNKDLGLLLYTRVSEASKCPFAESKADPIERIKGNISIAFRLCDMIPFFLFKLGDGAWDSVPFYYHDYPMGTFTTLFDKDHGLDITILLIDSDAGELLFFRKITLDQFFSNLFFRSCRQLQIITKPLSKEDLKTRIDAVYAKYPCPVDLLKGIPFYQSIVVAADSP